MKEPITIPEFQERLALAREKFREQRAEIIRLGRQVGVLLGEKAFLTNVIGVASKIIDADSLPDTLPDHPLIRTADDVAKFAADRVRWHQLAQYRYGLLDELVMMLDGGDKAKLPTDSEWIRLLGRVRTELLERIDV